MRHPFAGLFWSENDSEINKLAIRSISPDDIFEAIFGSDGEESGVMSDAEKKTFRARGK